MNVFIAGLMTETNTFSPLPTGHETFAETFLAHGDATAHESNPASAQLHVWRRAAEARGWRVSEGLFAAAQPGGRTVRHIYEGFRDEILADLEGAMPVDMVLLALHGAMAADGYDDCEGDLLKRVREIVGPDVPVGAELDLHCHVTDAMLTNATALITYKEYPHVDIPDRAEDLFALIAAAAEGETRPCMRAFDCRMIGMFRTPVAPMRGFVDRMMAAEGEDGVLSLSLGHGFPWGDVADVGAKMVAVTDGDPTLASGLAERFGRDLFAVREETRTAMLSVDAALDRALEIAGGPVVLADVADNAGGGAPSDSTFILRRILDRGLTGVATGLYWDPLAVRFCKEAGEGAGLDLRFGGRCGIASGDPIDLHVTVRTIRDDVTQRFGPSPARIGEAVWVEAQGVDIVLNTIRTQVFHPEAMTKLGIDLGRRKIVVVKSSQHFYAGFAPIAADVLYVTTPGAIAPQFDRIPYTKLRRPYWPKVDDPFAS